MLKDKMKKIDGVTIMFANLIITPILYMSILLPLTIFSNISMMVFPITILIHNLLYWALLFHVEKKA